MESDIVYANHFVIQYNPIDGYVLTMAQLSQPPLSDNAPAAARVVGQFAVPSDRFVQLCQMGMAELDARAKEAAEG